LSNPRHCSPVYAKLDDPSRKALAPLRNLMHVPQIAAKARMRSNLRKARSSAMSML
jgi:hypothetical protein